MPPRRRLLRLDAVGRAEVRGGGLWLLFAYMPTLTFRLIGRDGQTLFRRRQVADRTAMSVFQEDIAVIGEVLGKR